MKSFRPHWPTTLASAGIVLAAIAIVMAVALFWAYNRAQNVCLTDTLDQVWSWTGHKDYKRRLLIFKVAKSDQEMQDAKRQAEAIARIRIKTVAVYGESLCPTHWSRWVFYGITRRLFGSDEQSIRWQMIYPIAKAARSGHYEHPWPKEFDCAIDVKPTKIRISPRWKDIELRPMGKIGKNMTIYCPRT